MDVHCLFYVFYHVSFDPRRGEGGILYRVAEAGGTSPQLTEAGRGGGGGGRTAQV